MAINFILPNLLMQTMKMMLPAGIVIHEEEFVADIIEAINTPAAKAYMSKYERVIPADLPVFVINNQIEKAVLAKHGIEPSGVEMGGAMVMGIDSRHETALMIYEDHLDKEFIVRHEVVHYHQVVRGDLTYKTDGDIEWRKPGQQMSLNAIKSLQDREWLQYNPEKLLLNELKKPWEIEAYALTTPQEFVDEWPLSCKTLIKEYLSTH